MQKICFYCIATHLGGAERSLLEILGNLKKQGDVELLIVLPKDSGPLIPELDKLQLPYSVIPLPKQILRISRKTPWLSMLLFTRGLADLWRYIREVSAFIDHARPVAIYTTGIKCHFLGAWIGRKLAIPVIWHLRDIFTPGLTKLLLTITYLICRPRTLANSRSTARSFIGSDAEIEVIHNGISTKTFAPKPNRYFHEKFNLPEDAIVVGCMGALSRWKGQREFIAMAREVKKKHTQAHFVIVGDQIYDTATDHAYRESLYADVERHGMADYIHFHPFIRDDAMALNGLQLLVHTSIQPEPFGRIVIEAMACGVPVVAANAGGITEIIADGDGGLLYEMGNVNAMSSAVSRLLADEARQKSFAEAGRRRMIEHFTNDRYLDTINRVFTRYT